MRVIRVVLIALALLLLLMVIAVVSLVSPAGQRTVQNAFNSVPPYTVGLLLIGLAPAAPFLPIMVRRASGDLACVRPSC